MVNAVCAPSGLDWQGINWSRVNQQVKRLQARIVKATKDGRHGKVKALQWLLTHSFSGKALAVKRVTMNRGKHTPGVDDEIWKTPKAKANAIASLKRRGYKSLPLRRIHIPKKNGKTRPLGIPTMKDRAMHEYSGESVPLIPGESVPPFPGETVPLLPGQICC
ncbi:MAG: reverse transcriptase N-terminal domain-containing protein [Chlorobiales bacterium]|nr:reverse transcriptase N-terminal domain-containing protein [Chlorobiales bacterium]